VANAAGGVLEIRWTVSDKNLGPDPINLFYTTRKDGNWLPIVKGLKNDGAYRWTFPHDVGSQFYLRLEVADAAGNVTRCEPAQPVVLDMTEPKALVTGVTSVVPRGGAPAAN
jgi:hypothetical protein